MKRRQDRKAGVQSKVGRRRNHYRPRLEGLEQRELLTLSVVGSEFRVNTTLTSSQQAPGVAADTAGDFVVVWQSGDFTNGYDIKAQRYNPSGVAQGGEITVNSSTTNGNQLRFSPAVAMDSAGDFVVTWEYYDLAAANTVGYDVFARRFNAAGVAQANEFGVNTATANDQYDSDVAMDSAGDFVVTWFDSTTATVLFQRYNTAGAAQGSATGIDTSTTAQSLASVALDSSNTMFVVTWAGLSAADPNSGIYARRFNATTGAPLAATDHVNTTTTGTQTTPSVAINSSDNYVIAWSGNGTGDSQGVFFQRYNSSGVAQGVETRANTSTTGAQITPEVGISSQASTLGNFTIVWTDDTSEAASNRGVYAQNFTAAGAASGSQLHVNTTTTGDQTQPVIAVAGNGGVSVVWQSTQSGNTDIYAQRYSIDVAAQAPTANPQTVSVNQDTAKAITLTGSDPNSPALTFTFTIGTGPSHGALSGFNSSTGAVTYTPTAGYFGPDSFTFTTTNSASLTSSPATVTLNVIGKPSANAQSVTVNQDTAKAITLTGSDPNSPALTFTFTIGTGPSHGALSGFNSSTGAVTYTPTAGYFGPDSFTFTTTNSASLTSTAATVTLNVVGKPTANAQSVSTNQDTAKAITLTGSDPNSPARTLTYILVSSPSNGALSGFNSSTGAVTYTPASNYSGGDSFTFKVNNGVVDSAVATVTITVNASVATVTQATVNWGSRTSGALVTQADGLRLLPSGRSMDFPWLNISQLGITLSGAVALSASDVTVSSLSGTVYGPVTLTGGGSSYGIVLAQPISAGDRVTLTISNSGLTTYTRRLDVLPGDVNDDGNVNSTDATIALAASRNLTVVIPLLFIDIDGDGFVTATDYNLVRARSGKTLP